MLAQALSPLDRALDRVLTIAGPVRGRADQPAARTRAFELILLVHLTTRFATGAFPDSEATPWLRAGLAATLAACLALHFVERLAPLAIGVAICAQLTLLAATFPGTGNHFYLELWALVLLLVVGRDDEPNAALLLAALRWSIAIVLFYTGLQKLRYGTYLGAQYLTFEMAVKPEFEAVFAPLVPESELARIRALVPGRVGDGPFRSDAPLLLLASNLVVAFELVAPFALLWWRTRRLAVLATLAFTVAIQSGAREVYFGGLLVSWILLFWPSSLHARAPLAFAAYYAALAGLRFLAPDLVVMR